MSVNLKRMSMVFDEWARRYSEDPEQFGDVLDENGVPVSGYGICCAVYFNRIADEMDALCLLPRQA